MNTTDLNKFVKCDIFTPEVIANIMLKKIKKSGTLLEPSVGNGCLIKNIDFNNYASIDVYELKKEYLDDMVNHNIINKYNEDFLKAKHKQKYDNIIMNPPYIKVQDLTIDYRKFLKTTFTQLVGIIDIYYAFIIKCIQLLKDDGIMVAITPNTYLYNKSALCLRKYLIDNQYIKEIIDFKEKKVFKGISVYCCITVFTKSKKEYITYNSKKITYKQLKVNYSLFNFNKQETNNLKSICKITNGIATLRDKIYIKPDKPFDEPCWKKITTGRDDKYIIYPYNDGEIIDEETFKYNNPKTYNYLLENKDELAKRDRGKKKYPLWFAYGRKQSIKIPDVDNCIYISTFIDPDKIEDAITIRKPLLHTSSLCIRPLNENVDIENIKNIIIKNKDFIKENSPKRSSGWITVSSRILYLLNIG